MFLAALVRVWVAIFCIYTAFLKYQVPFNTEFQGKYQIIHSSDGRRSVDGQVILKSGHHMCYSFFYSLDELQKPG